MKNQLRKDFLEMLRTYRLYVVLGAFLFFGITAPAIMKILPNLVPESGEMTVIFKETTAVSAATQYFQYISQMATLLIAGLSAASIAGSKNRQFQYILLSKPISRQTYLLSAFLSNLILLSLGLLAGHLSFWFYTEIIFGGVSGTGMLFSFAASILYLTSLLALTVLFSTFIKGSLQAAVISVISFFVICGTMGIFESIRRFSPSFLIDESVNVVTGASGASVMISSAIPALALAVIMLFLAFRIYDRLDI